MDDHIWQAQPDSEAGILEIPAEPTRLGTRRGIRGLVWIGDRCVGKAFQASRVAAGKGGARGVFYTAAPSYPGIPAGSGPSLGTRFTTQERAAQALRAFADQYPPAYIRALGVEAIHAHSRRYNWPVDTSQAERYGMFQAVAQFKTTHPVT
jgi:hypothetical protein